MALGMFTTIPLRFNSWDDDGAKHMLVFYPLIGFIIGLIWYGGYSILHVLNLPVMIFTFFMMIFPYLITGLLHLDGYMDVHDAILSRRDREEKLRILKDSHTGAFSVIAVSLLLIFNFASMNTLLSENKMSLLLIFIPMLSRSFIVLAMVFLKTLPQSSSMAYFKKHIEKVDKGLLIGLFLITLGIYFYILNISGLICAGGMILCTSIVVYKAVKDLGGMSGDIAGYGLVICEAIGILMMALV